jgi:hypothetical protein
MKAEPRYGLVGFLPVAAILAAMVTAHGYGTSYPLGGAHLTAHQFPLEVRTPLRTSLVRTNSRQECGKAVQTSLSANLTANLTANQFKNEGKKVRTLLRTTLLRTACD